MDMENPSSPLADRVSYKKKSVVVSMSPVPINFDADLLDTKDPQDLMEYQDCSPAAKSLPGY